MSLFNLRATSGFWSVCYFFLPRLNTNSSICRAFIKTLFPLCSQLWLHCPYLRDSSKCNFPASARKQSQDPQRPTSQRLVMVVWTAQVPAPLCIPTFFALRSWTKAVYWPSAARVLGGAHGSHGLPPRWQRSAASKGLDY